MLFLIFFFQAEDGIRDSSVTGVQTCALPIFDPARLWPILIVTSTTDFGCTSIRDAPWYRDAAMKEGWIVRATDATISPRADSLQWRLSILTAALQMIRNDWPQSAQWPVAFAGFSGGAKRSGILAPILPDNPAFQAYPMFLAAINPAPLTPPPP